MEDIQPKDMPLALELLERMISRMYFDPNTLVILMMDVLKREKRIRFAQWNFDYNPERKHL